MPANSYPHRRALAALPRRQLVEHQLHRLNQLLAAILPQNRFYAERLAGIPLPLTSPEEIASLPYTTKEELLGDSGVYAANLTWPRERYTRLHRTSGTRGRPLVVLDTSEDWRWWIDTWQYVLDAAEVEPGDRALMAFSFGPFIGFWSAFDAAADRGLLTIPTGGMSTRARLELLRELAATVVFCTPSYALHLAESARECQLELARFGVRRLVVAGEPGGSLPSVRQQLESAWNARVIDHAGASEVGPWGYGDVAGNGLHVIESEFLAEFLSIDGDRPAASGELAELVLTTLGRQGAPVIRYRTGDLVRPHWNEQGFVFLSGGVLGRADDMLIIRGVNIFPSSLEEILRSFPEVAEFRITARRRGALDELSIEVEDPFGQPERIARELQFRLGLRVEVCCVPAGSLPRFHGKGQRFLDQR